MKRKTALFCMLAVTLAAVIALAAASRGKEVRTVTVHWTGAQRTLTAAGEAAPEYTCTLRFSAAGQVASCAKRAGERAEKGQGIICLAGDNTAQALASALSAKGDWTAAEAQARQLTVRAAFDGRVTQVLAVPGQTVAAGDAAAEMAGGRQTAVCTMTLNAYEAFAGAIAITAAAEEGIAYPAVLTQAVPLPAEGVRAVFVVEGAPFWPEGTEIQVTCVTEQWEDACFLPESAVRDGMVQLAGDKGLARVSLLYRENGQWAVRGLAEGEQVLVP